MTNSKRNIGKNIKQLPLLAEMSEKDLKAREKSLMLMKKVAEKAPIKRKLEENFTPEELEVIKSDIKEEQAKAEKYRKLHSAEER